MNFAETAKSLLANHGVVRSQPLSDWSGPFPLPKQLQQFYLEVGPVDVIIEAHGNPYFFPYLSKLWSFQAGYRLNGISGERISEWPSKWIVIADEGGDPFIFDGASGRVLFAIHGTGNWDARPLFTDVNIAAACLAAIGAIVVTRAARIWSTIARSSRNFANSHLIAFDNS